MSHVLSLVTTAASSFLIDLRPADLTGVPSGTAFYKAVKLRVTAVQNGVAAAAYKIAPIVVPDGATPPAPTVLNLAGNTPVFGTTYIDSTANPSVELGQSYGPGYSPAVFREIVATHLAVTHVASGLIQIVVD